MDICATFSGGIFLTLILGQKPLHISTGLLIVAAFAVLGLRLYFLYIPSPNLGAMETSVVYGLQRVLAGMPLYSDPAQAPFAIIQYSPLYYEWVGGIGKWLAIDPDQPMQVFLLNRWAGLIFNLLSLGGLGLILKPLALPRYMKWALLAIAWLCLEPAHYARPDSLQALFFLLFVWAALQHEAKGKTLFVLLMALAAVLACWSKQNGILLPIFLLFYLIILKKQPIQALWAFLMMVFASLMLGFLMVENVNMLLANVIQGVDNGISFSYFFSAIYDAGVKKFFPLFVPGLYFVLVWLLFPASSPRRFLGWLLAGSFAFATLTALKWGSIPSYYTDFVHLSLIALAVALAEWRAAGKLNFSPQTTLAMSLVILLFIPLHTSGKEWGRVWKEGKEGSFEQAEKIRQAVQKRGLQADEYLFTHDFLINIFLFRNCLFPQNDIVYCCAAPRGTYDYSSFAADIAADKVRFVIDWRAEKPRAFLGQKFEEYVLKDTLGSHGLWERDESNDFKKSLFP